MLMGYDGVAVSTTDLTAGLAFLKKDYPAFPWISVNIFDKNGNLLFQPYIIKNINELKVGILGITGFAANIPEGITIGAWQEALQKQLTYLKQDCGMIVVLSNLSEAENTVLAEKFPDVDLLISSLKRHGNVRPRIIRNTLITQVLKQGKYLGQLHMDWYANGTYRTDPTTSSLALLRRKLSLVNVRLKQLLQHKQNDQPDLSQKIAAAESEKNNLIRLIEDRNSAMAQATIPPVNRYTTSFIPIRPISSKNRVAVIVDQVKRKLDDLAQARAEAQRKQVENDNFFFNIGYTGSTTCARCHPQQFTFWQKTGHARAFSTLVRKKQSANSECLPCHVTPGNVFSYVTEKNRLLTLPPKLHNVGCEVCHGPGKNHSNSPQTITPAGHPAPEKCKRCHTNERDEDFNYPKKLKDISCPATHS